jgi:Flp pilus assembly protein TadG
VLSRTIISLWRCSEGSAVVEGAVIDPLLFVLVLGVFEFSWFFYKQQLVEAGVRDGARYLARTALDTTPATNPCNNATFVANAKTIATTVIDSASNGSISGTTARVATWGVGNVTVSCPSFDNSGGTYSGPTSIYSVTVSTSFPDPALGFLGFLKLGTLSLSASHTERSIGPG